MWGKKKHLLKHSKFKSQNKCWTGKHCVVEKIGNFLPEALTLMNISKCFHSSQVPRRALHCWAVTWAQIVIKQMKIRRSGERQQGLPEVNKSMIYLISNSFWKGRRWETAKSHYIQSLVCTINMQSLFWKPNPVYSLQHCSTHCLRKSNERTLVPAKGYLMHVKLSSRSPDIS